jgi:hypothetical protein
VPTTPDELIPTVRVGGTFAPEARRALWIRAIDGVMIVVVDLGEAGRCVPTTPDEQVSEVRLDGLVRGAFVPEAGPVLWVHAADGVTIVVMDLGGEG